MNARNRKREPRPYRVPLRTRQHQAKIVRSCFELKTLITLSPPFSGAPKDGNALNKCVRELLDALASLFIEGICFIEFNDPNQVHGRNVPHFHIVTTSEFTYRDERISPEDELFKELLSVLARALPWFGTSYLSKASILDVKPITDLDRLAGYLAKLEFELDGEILVSMSKQNQKVIPAKYFPMRRMMRFFGGYDNPLKNQK